MTIATHPAPAPPTLQSYSAELLRKFWTTYSVRFESGRRLEKSHAMSRFATSMLSGYVICVTVVEILLIQRQGADHPLLPLVTIAAPVFILIIEAHEASKNYLVKADHMHRSAQAVQVLYFDLELLAVHAGITVAELERLSNEYHRILREFPEHHENVDYNNLRWLSPSHFPPADAVGRFRTFLRGPAQRAAMIWFMPMLLVIVPGVLVWYATMSLVRGAPPP